MKLRKAFTLVELLIVMSIIAILLALTVWVLGSFVTTARDAATQTTIRKIQAMLNERAEALQRLTHRGGYLQSQYEYLLAGQITTDNTLRLCLTQKMLYRKFFPQRKADVTDAALYPAIFNAASANSSEILYQFLTQSNVLGTLPQASDAFSTSEVRDVDGNGLPEFIDAWGNPLRFYRWPTRLFRPQGFGTWAAPNPIDAANARYILTTLPSFSGNAANDLSRDPDDPLRKAAYLLCQSAVPGSDGLEALGFHTPATYHVMLVVSAGQDGEFGMYDPDDAVNFGHLGQIRIDPNPALPPNTPVSVFTDDITYLNVRTGGR